jgi:hypothetical protein
VTFLARAQRPTCAQTNLQRSRLDARVLDARRSGRKAEALVCICQRRWISAPISIDAAVSNDPTGKSTKNSHPSRGVLLGWLSIGARRCGAAERQAPQPQSRFCDAHRMQNRNTTNRNKAASDSPAAKGKNITVLVITPPPRTHAHIQSCSFLPSTCPFPISAQSISSYPAPVKASSIRLPTCWRRPPSTTYGPAVHPTPNYPPPPLPPSPPTAKHPTAATSFREAKLPNAETWSLPDASHIRAIHYIHTYIHTIPYRTILYHTIPYHTLPTYLHTYTRTSTQPI